MKEIYNEVANRLNLPVSIVEKTYKAYWKSIKIMIKDIPLKKSLTEEQFNKYRTNFIVPNLGKLSCTYDRFLGIKKKIEYLNNLEINDKT